MLCILCHQGIQLILAYSWARPASLVAVKVEGECFYFFCFFTFIPFLFLPYPSLSSLLLTLLSLFLLGVVGCGKSVVYLMSPGRPTDIGLQLGKAC